MSFSRISDQNGSKDDWVIQVRLCSMWEAVAFKSNNDVFELEMVFVDDQGDSIQGYVRKNHIRKFKPFFKESAVYAILNFKVGIASTQYRVVANVQRIYFNITTSVRAITPVPAQFPIHAFSFATDEILEGRVGNNTLLTDIIGCVIAMGPIETVATGPKKEIQLRNKNHTVMRVTLWGRTSQMFDLGPYEVALKPVIAVITSTTMRKFKGDFSYGTTTATQTYFNLDLPEVTVLSGMFAPGYEGIQMLQHDPTPQVSLAEQASVNRTTIAEILAMEWVADKQFLFAQEYICTFIGEIVEIEQRYGWCYVSCNHCSKKLVPKSGSFHCSRCNKACSYPIIRYKLHVRVKDQTGSTMLVIFNDDVEKFIKIPASSFMERVRAANNDLPHEISNVIGKTFVFKIKVTNYNLKDGLENYTVTKIFEEVAPDQKRKVSAESPPADVVHSNNIESSSSSSLSMIDPVTPDKQACPSKKIKTEQ